MDIVQIIENLMVPNSATIRQATKDLEEFLKTPEAVIALFDVMVGNPKLENRQFSAVQLKRHMSKLRKYQQLPMEVRAHIKGNIVIVIFNEKVEAVRGAIVHFLGVIVTHESHLDEAWVGEVLQFIFNQCSVADSCTAEIGFFVFGKLAELSPDPFIQHFVAVKGIFQAVLVPLEGGNATTNISPTIINNVLTGMSGLVPRILGNTDAEQTYEAAIPYIVTITNKFAVEGHLEHFSTALDVLHNLAELTPMLLNRHLRLLMEFAFAISSNAAYDAGVRIATLNFICVVVNEKKKLLLKLKMIEPMLNMTFNIMATEPESKDPDEFFEESENDTPLMAATVLIDTMASVMSPEKFISPLLAILEPALQNTDDNLRRRAAFIVMGTVAEGCKLAIRDKYLENMLNIVKQGLNDPVGSVRNAALFAIGQFSEQLQPEITDYANEILPLLMNHVHDIIQAQKMGQQVDTKNVERAFYAIETFCGSMDKALAPYLEGIMSMVLELLSSNHDGRIKILAMSLIESAAMAYEGCLLPWFHSLVEQLKPLLFPIGKDDEDGLRSQAINTVAAIVRNTKKQFLPFAQEIMQHCVIWIESTTDIDVRKALINLCGALSLVVNDDLALILPSIVNHMTRIMAECNEETNDNESETAEIDLDDSSDDGDSDSTIRYGNNPYLEAKVQVMETLEEFSKSCMQIMLPLAENLFEMIFKVLEHGYTELRSTAITTAKEFTINWVKFDPNAPNANKALQMLMSKLDKIIRNDDESQVVVDALDAISDILIELGTISLPDKEIRDTIAKCIKSGLAYDLTCLFATKDDDDENDEDEYESEMDTSVIQSVANLLPSFGKALNPMEFAIYFENLEPCVLKHMKKDGDLDRSFLIGVLAECYAPLGTNVGPYFGKHIKLMLSASKRKNSNSRQNGIFGLGELIRAGKEISYDYFPEVLGTFSNALANEKNRTIIDNIVSALARLILTNATLVPLDQVIPAMLQKLPIVDDEAENAVVMEGFEYLYDNFPAMMQTYTAAIATIGIQTLALDIADNEDIVKSVANLLQKVRTIYPNEYKEAMANPALSSLMPKVHQNAAGFF